MRIRVLGLLALIATLLFVALPATAQPAPARIVAVGDLHGDYDAWAAIARAAGLIDGSGRWTGGATTLVQTGDIVDRGPDSLKIIDQLIRLQRDAPGSGGRVMVLTGNHEAMMVINDLRYVHPGEYAAFVTPASARLREAAYTATRTAIEAAAKARNPAVTRADARRDWLAQTPLGFAEHRLAWASSGRLGKWAIANPVAFKLGDTLFVHGGISAEYAAIPLPELNRRAAAELAAASEDEAAVINDSFGPLWYRGLVTRRGDDDDGSTAGTPPKPNPVKLPPRPTIEQELATVLSAHRVKRIVIGHTPTLSGIVIANQGRLIRIDSGNSRYYNGQPSYLEILGDRVIAYKVPRPTPTRGANP